MTFNFFINKFCNVPTETHNALMLKYITIKDLASSVFTSYLATCRYQLRYAHKTSDVFTIKIIISQKIYIIVGKKIWTKSTFSYYQCYQISWSSQEIFWFSMLLSCVAVEVWLPVKPISKIERKSTTVCGEPNKYERRSNNLLDILYLNNNIIVHVPLPSFTKYFSNQYPWTELYLVIIM